MAFSALRSALEGAGVHYAVGDSGASTAFGEPRFTNGVDIVADFTGESLVRFLGRLPKTFYTDPEGALDAHRLGRSFNVTYWFKAGGEVSGVQWRDIRGIVRACGASLDRGYLGPSAAKLGIVALLEKALHEV